MRDIAQHVGVSQTTVSFVLNENPNFSIQESTRNAVLKSAAALGYEQPKRKRRKSRLRIIGLLIDEIATSALMADLLDGVTEMANRHGCHVPTILTRGSNDAANSALNSWHDSDLLGIIYSSIVTGPVTISEEFKQTKTLLLNCHSAGPDFTSILPGETLGGISATSKLIDQGCRDIIHITGETWIEAVQKRANGFRTGLESANIDGADERIYHTTFNIRAGYETMKRLLSERPCPEGVFCGNDWVAQGVYQALIEQGHWPGKDVKIVGYDNLFFTEDMSPPLTTVNLPYREMGQLAVEMLVEAEGKTLPAPRQVKLPCDLVPRESA